MLGFQLGALQEAGAAIITYLSDCSCMYEQQSGSSLPLKSLRWRSQEFLTATISSSCTWASSNCCDTAAKPPSVVVLMLAFIEKNKFSWFQLGRDFLRELHKCSNNRGKTLKIKKNKTNNTIDAFVILYADRKCSKSLPTFSPRNDSLL